MHVRQPTLPLRRTFRKSFHAVLLLSLGGLGCGPTGLKRVVPKEPDNSLLVKKLNPSPVCGNRMPPANPNHFDNNPGELTLIRSWILADAPNN